MGRRYDVQSEKNGINAFFDHHVARHGRCMARCDRFVERHGRASLRGETLAVCRDARPCVSQAVHPVNPDQSQDTNVTTGISVQPSRWQGFTKGLPYQFFDSCSIVLRYFSDKHRRNIEEITEKYRTNDIPGVWEQYGNDLPGACLGRCGPDARNPRGCVERLGRWYGEIRSFCREVRPL